MRGEHSHRRRVASCGAGSSPHARGARRPVHRRHVPKGLIPACAGSTYEHPRSLDRVRAHPRMRGEHDAALALRAPPTGSSPHARGAPLPADTEIHRDGLIPACAGSTRARRQLHQPCAAHPRMRGEHLRDRTPPRAGFGSSPHARGARRVPPTPPAPAGLIPACAGSTGDDCERGSGSPAHPRMRGEHGLVLATVFAVLGSSPHARGARGLHLPVPARPRLIPACAGSTASSGAGPHRFRAHPRMRGEHTSSRARNVSFHGSSPHARGARHARCDCGRRTGLIPACAGSTVRDSQSALPRGAHPRMRGEHRAGMTEGTRSNGSSPHARGARSPLIWESPRSRLIPACAGSTMGLELGPFALRAHPRMRGEHVGLVHVGLPVQGSSPHARGALRGRP